jgi:hypothetical protein
VTICRQPLEEEVVAGMTKAKGRGLVDAIGGNAAMLLVVIGSAEIWVKGEGRRESGQRTLAG